MNDKTMLTVAAVVAIICCIGAVYMSFTTGGWLSYVLGLVALILLIFVAKKSRQMNS